MIFIQFWTPILMTQVVVGDTIGDGIEGSYCGADHSLVGHNTFKWIAVIESMWTYAIPFCITLCTDIAVLVFANESKRFTA
jgi:hypothetical protein